MKHNFLWCCGAAMIVAALLLGTACDKTDPDTIDCTGVSPTYTADIQPIFAASCATPGCHSAATAQENIDLSTYAGSVNCATNHELRCSIEHGSSCHPMPVNAAKLPEAQIKKIICWVQNGMPQ